MGGESLLTACLSSLSGSPWAPNYLKSSSLQMVVVLVETHLAQVQLFGTFHNGDERTDYFKYPHNYGKENVLGC